MMNKYKVLITTSGVGQRLGDLTAYINKSLVRLAKKPVLSHIIENYPKDVEIVITVRHLGQQVKDFVELAYPDRKIVFSEEPAEPPKGKDFSLAYSMLYARKHLNCPFIFHAGDTVVMEPVPSPLEGNFCGGFKGGSTVNYRSFTELDDKVFGFNDKGASDYDYLHIGLVGIKDYEKFWQAMEELYNQDPLNPSLGDVPVLDRLVKTHACGFAVREFKTWLDIGNIEALNSARQKLGDELINLDKPDEAIYMFENFVVKFMANAQVVENKIKRAKILEGLVPEIEGFKNNFYRYKYLIGRLYSRVVTPKDFDGFLRWLKASLWKKSEEASRENFEKICLDFYQNKTLKRVKQFYELTGIQDEALIINGESVPSLAEILKKIDFQALSQGRQVRVHGDLVLDNCLKTPDGYALLDWRQDFGGLLESGDWYYDLAKLNHNFIVNHDLVFRNNFSIKVRGSTVVCDILRSQNLADCQELLWKFIESEGLDLSRVKIITALIWLNSAPLHHHPYNLFLHYFGRLKLWQTVKE